MWNTLSSRLGGLLPCDAHSIHSLVLMRGRWPQKALFFFFPKETPGRVPSGMRPVRGARGQRGEGLGVVLSLCLPEVPPQARDSGHGSDRDHLQMWERPEFIESEQPYTGLSVCGKAQTHTSNQMRKSIPNMSTM